MASDLQSAINDLQTARTSVMAGEYGQALTCYDGFIAQLARYLHNVRDPADRDRWYHIKNKVKEEVSIVQKYETSLSDLLRRPQLKKQPSSSSVSERDDRLGAQPKKVAPPPRRNTRAQPPAQNPPSYRKAEGPPKSDAYEIPGRPGRSKQREPPQLPSEQARQAGENPRDIKPTASQYEGISPEVVAAVSECIVENTGITFDQIAGLPEAKRLLEEAVVLPMVLPDFFTGILSPWRGVLLFGPPGTGKTLLAKATAAKAGFTFFAVTASNIESKYRGEAEKMVRGLYTIARARAPSCIFLDEIDALMSARGTGEDNECSRRIKSEILTQMQGITTQNGVVSEDSSGQQCKIVMTLAATNLPWDLDEALKRRLEKRIYIPLPDFESRRQLLELNLKDISSKGLDLDALAKRLEGYSGADISILIREVSMTPLRRAISGKTLDEIRQLNNDPEFKKSLVVLPDDFEKAIEKTKPSVNSADIKKHEEWFQKFGSV